MSASTEHEFGANGTERRDGDESTRILLVDDHPIVRRGLAMLINTEQGLSICGEVDGLSQAMRAYYETQPHLVVSDVTLKNGSGLELVKELVAQNSTARVLVCSVHDDMLYAERAIRAGARGYVNKAVATSELTSAIRRVLSGSIYLSPHVSDHMLNRRIGNGKPVDHKSPVESFSDRELEVFEQIGHGVATRQIAEKLHLSPKTIETYRENIKAKLSAENGAELTRYAVKWVLEGN